MKKRTKKNTDNRHQRTSATYRYSTVDPITIAIKFPLNSPLQLFYKNKTIHNEAQSTGSFALGVISQCILRDFLYSFHH